MTSIEADPGSPLNVLALEPYDAGSHHAFLRGWSEHSRHRWDIRGLSGRKWKWRMHHAPLTFLSALEQEIPCGAMWDVIFCSDMLDVAQFRGLASPSIRKVPLCVYFHENQLTYPVGQQDERDFHFGYVNMTTCLAADAVWFNSQANLDLFLGALPAFLKRMPDYAPIHAVEEIRAKAVIEPLGIATIQPRERDAAQPLKIAWAARWEHDKNPGALLSALLALRSRGVDFRISVMGERFERCPREFDELREQLGDSIDAWAFLPRAEYERVLATADVFVSTATHEFFGISVVEAISAGCHALLPNDLVYPELLGLLDISDPSRWLYARERPDDVRDLVRSLTQLAEQKQRGELVAYPALRSDAIDRLSWRTRVVHLDDAIERVARSAVYRG